MRFQLMIWWFEVGADETVGGGVDVGRILVMLYNR